MSSVTVTHSSFQSKRNNFSAAQHPEIRRNILQTWTVVIRTNRTELVQHAQQDHEVIQRDHDVIQRCMPSCSPCFKLLDWWRPLSPNGKELNLYSLDPVDHFKKHLKTFLFKHLVKLYFSMKQNSYKNTWLFSKLVWKNFLIRTLLGDSLWVHHKQWGKKVFTQPHIVQVLPHKKMSWLLR